MKLTSFAAYTTTLFFTGTLAAYPITGDNVNCRSGPGTSYSVTKTYAKGHEVTISCQTSGTDVSGDSIWDKTSDGCYVADHYVKTGTDGYVTSKCSSGGGATTFDGIPSVGVLHHGDATKHFCTASVIESQHGNVILTAAHCISGSGKGIVFSPGYHDGDEPYGSYPVTAAYVHPNWNQNHNIDYDFAFLTLGKGDHGGKAVDVQSVVGGNILVTSDGYQNTVEVVGYNDNEQKPRQCRVGTYKAETGQLGFTCGPFSSGTSGSPWIANYNASTKRGNVIGNIGGWHTGGCTSGVSYSSKYGTGTLSVYSRANTGSSGDSVRGGASSGC